MRKWSAIGAAGCLAIGMNAAECVYTSGASSLAEGKVLFEYDGSDKITRLTMTPDIGETLTMTGATLPFAANAHVVLGRNGKSVIANAFTAAGTLNLEGDESRPKWSTTASGLMSKSYETLFENTDLASVVPVDANPVSYLSYGRDSRKICHVNRGVDDDGYSYLRFEYQTLGGTAVRGIYVELRQNGNTVEGKVLAAKNGSLVDAADFACSMFYDFDPAPFSKCVDYRICGADASDTGFGINSLTVGPDGGSRLTLPVADDLTLSQPFAGGGVTLVFDAAAANATVTAAAANTMTNTAYVVNGDAEHRLTFNATEANALPSGTIDVYGDDTTLRISKGVNSSGGISSGKCAIAMHGGSVLESRAAWPFHPKNQEIRLDGATLSLESNNKYVNDLTLANGSTVVTYGNNAKSRLGNGKDTTWHVTGIGVSTCAPDLILFSNGNNWIWINFVVEDTVAGDEADFIVSGNFSIDGTHKNAVFEKTGAGTMRVDGNFRLTNQDARVTEGTLLINKSGSTTSAVKFQLQGGTLGFAAGTANTTGSIACTAPSRISVGAGASLVAENLAVPDGATLEIDGDVLSRNIRIAATIDDAIRSRIRLNGKRIAQTDGGYLCPAGFVITFR